MFVFVCLLEHMCETRLDLCLVLILVKWLFRGHRRQTSMLLIVPLLNGLYRCSHHKQCPSPCVGKSVHLDLRLASCGVLIVLYSTAATDCILDLWSEKNKTLL